MFHMEYFYGRLTDLAFQKPLTRLKRYRTHKCQISDSAHPTKRAQNQRILQY